MLQNGLSYEGDKIISIGNQSFCQCGKSQVGLIFISIIYLTYTQSAKHKSVWYSARPADIVVFELSQLQCKLDQNK